MAGIYIHIPFCKQACHYCDFHFSTNLKPRQAMVDALCKEIVLQKSYLGNQPIQTIYFGGGTPSILTTQELNVLLDTVYKHFSVLPEIELTLEANPDDLTKDTLAALSSLGINRLSIGIQSFHEPHLRYLNRAHTAQQAQTCVLEAQNAGITNISIDLIYAIPASGHHIWQQDLEQAVALGVPHISSYNLTIEPHTVFGNWLGKGKINAVDDDFAATQFEMLIAHLGQHGYEQYEISNFAKTGCYARHNSNYWKQTHYLGIGPGAHSYNGASRQYNLANNAKYITAIQKHELPATVEILSATDQINEYILTSLRTKWGCNLAQVEAYGRDLWADNLPYLSNLIAQGKAELIDGTLLLTQAGKLMADRIAADLFY